MQAGGYFASQNKETYMKTIRVAAIMKATNEENEPIIFATQWGYGDLKGGWEFPGGKIEEGETSAGKATLLTAF